MQALKMEDKQVCAITNCLLDAVCLFGKTWASGERLLLSTGVDCSDLAPLVMAAVQNRAVERNASFMSSLWSN